MGGTHQGSFDPFLLPLCACGGPTELLRREPNDTAQARIYRCNSCGAEHTEIARAARRKRAHPGLSEPK